MIPHLAYVDFPRQITKISFGILKCSTVLANTKEFGGITHSETVFVTKLLGLKFFGSTISELTLVKILNSSETIDTYFSISQYLRFLGFGVHFLFLFRKKISKSANKDW